MISEGRETYEVVPMVIPVFCLEALFKQQYNEAKHGNIAELRKQKSKLRAYRSGWNLQGRVFKRR